MRHIGGMLALAALACAPARARAQDAATAPTPTQMNVSWSRDGAITGAAAVGAALAALIPVDRTRLWSAQLLPLDKRQEGRLSQKAAQTSDVLAAADVLTPLALIVGQGGGFNDANGRRVLVYGESIAVSLLANSVTKYAVGRPRPYAYSEDPRVRAYADDQGKDSRLSFFSGHASTTFAASVAGAYIYSQASGDRATRAAIWGFQLALAGATADLRTRAGKHFYSDVIVGAAVGAGVGFAIPRLHGGPSYGPSAVEWAVIAGAPVLGVVIGELLPARPSILQPLSPIAVPYLVPGGGGLSLAGAF